MIEYGHIYEETLWEGNTMFTLNSCKYVTIMFTVNINITIPNPIYSLEICINAYL